MFSLRMPPRWRLATAAALVGAVSIYGLMFRGKDSGQPWEPRSPLPTTGPAARAVGQIVAAGNLEQSLIGVALMTAALVALRRRSSAWVPAVSFGCAAVAITLVGKPLFDHRIGHGLSYPSSHAGVLESALLAFALCAWPSSKLLAGFVGGFAIALPACVWLGNYHRLSEVIAGTAVASGIALVTSGMVATRAVTAGTSGTHP